MNRSPVSKPPNSSAYGVIKILSLCFATSFFLFASGIVIWNLYRLLTFDKTEGIVASVNAHETGGKTPATIYDLSVGFHTAKRQIYTSVGKSVFYKSYEKGDKALIYYDPQNPNDAIINTFGTLWFVPTLLFLIGLIPLFIVIPGKVADGRQIKADEEKPGETNGGG